MYFYWVLRIGMGGGGGRLGICMIWLYVIYCRVCSEGVYCSSIVGVKVLVFYLVCVGVLL